MRRHERRDEPVRVDEVGAAGRSPCGAGQNETGTTAATAPATDPGERCRDPRAVREAVVPEAGGRDDLDLDARRASCSTASATNTSGDVAGVPWVGGRQDDDSQGTNLLERHEDDASSPANRRTTGRPAMGIAARRASHGVPGPGRGGAGPSCTPSVRSRATAAHRETTHRHPPFESVKAGIETAPAVHDHWKPAVDQNMYLGSIRPSNGRWSCGSCDDECGARGIADRADGESCRTLRARSRPKARRSRPAAHPAPQGAANSGDALRPEGREQSQREGRQRVAPGPVSSNHRSPARTRKAPGRERSIRAARPTDVKAERDRHHRQRDGERADDGDAAANGVDPRPRAARQRSSGPERGLLGYEPQRLAGQDASQLPTRSLLGRRHESSAECGENVATSNSGPPCLRVHGRTSR